MSPENPYIGPRAFRRGERLYGRDRENRELSDLIEAERVVLLHAPSGAGKTSLIQAGLINSLELDGFWVSGPIRLNVPPPRDVRNRYVWSVARSLKDWPSLDLGAATLSQILDLLEANRADDEHVLVFDQFEDILSLDPSDVDGVADFFQQLGAALNDPRRYALFSMREDYLGGTDGYLRDATSLRTWYRLDFLTTEGARRAVKLPAEDRGVIITDEAADALVENLSTIVIHQPDKGNIAVRSPRVEPVLLQVVCRQLWEQLQTDRRDQLTKVEVRDVQRLPDPNQALSEYYSNTVSATAASSMINERLVRDWIESSLISPTRSRSSTNAGPPVDASRSATMMEFLQDRYLIRAEARGGAMWYELSHDRLIEPILTSNNDWRLGHLNALQLAAHRWERNSRNSALLLAGEELREAIRDFEDEQDVTEVERAFVEASLQQARVSRLLLTSGSVITALFVLVVIETFLLVFLAFQ